MGARAQRHWRNWEGWHNHKSLITRKLFDLGSKQVKKFTTGFRQAPRFINPSEEWRTTFWSHQRRYSTSFLTRCCQYFFLNNLESALSFKIEKKLSRIFQFLFYQRNLYFCFTNENCSDAMRMLQKICRKSVWSRSDLNGKNCSRILTNVYVFRGAVH